MVCTAQARSASGGLMMSVRLQVVAVSRIQLHQERDKLGTGHLSGHIGLKLCTASVVDQKKVLFLDLIKCRLESAVPGLGFIGLVRCCDFLVAHLCIGILAYDPPLMEP